MKKIAWITDSTCAISKEMAEKHNIVVLPLNIIFIEGIYRDGIDMSEREFYEKLAISPEIPKTSPPSVGETVEVFSKLKQEYDMGIAVHISGHLSNTIQVSLQAAEITDFKLEVIDSKLMSLPLIEMILHGKKQLEEGRKVEDVVQELRNMHKKSHIYLVPGSLEQLRKGGRVSSFGYLLGSLLNIKPIITLNEGITDTFSKIRKKNKALKKMALYFTKQINLGKKIKKVFILDGNEKNESEILSQYIKDISPDVKIEKGDVGAIIGTHTGKGTVGISWFED